MFDWVTEGLSAPGVHFWSGYGPFALQWTGTVDPTAPPVAATAATATAPAATTCRNFPLLDGDFRVPDGGFGVDGALGVTFTVLRRSIWDRAR